jgi:hypothetical protein
MSHMASRIFISHISEEAPLASLISERLETDFLGLVKPFVSTDTDSIAAGSNWLKSIDEALKSAKVLLVLCSKSSVNRPWINFEAGAAWLRKIPIVPLCHSDLAPSELPMPLSLLQGTAVSDPDGVKRLYKLIAETIGCKVPKAGITDFVAAAAQYEVGKAAPSTSRSDAKPTLANAASRMRDLLEEPKFRYRSIGKLATVAGISEAQALDILQTDPDVVFSKGRAGNRIARLKWR